MNKNIKIPYDIMIDNLKIAEYNQVEFDDAELETVRGYEMKQGVYTTKGELQTASYNPYDYDSSDLETDSDSDEMNQHNEKITKELPLPVTTTTKDEEKLTKRSKFLLFLICLMLFSISQHSSSCLKTIPTDQTPDELEPTPIQYQHTERLEELYNNFNSNL